MKFLIWISCAFMYGLINTALSFNGITFGGLPTIALGALMFALARTLCKELDNWKQPDPPPDPMQTDLPDPATAPPTPKPENKPAPSKARYCKLCGSPIDSETKKCTGCGKQYLSPAIIRRAVFIILATVLIAGAVFLAYSQYNHHLAELSDYQNQIDALDTTISNLKSEINELQRENNSLVLQTQRQETKLEQQEEVAAKTAAELRFFHLYAAIVPDDGSGLYHQYSCPNLPLITSKFWIYNIEAAKGKGYTPCPECYN